MAETADASEVVTAFKDIAPVASFVVTLENKNLEMKVIVGDCLMLRNTSDDDVVLPAGTIICGFWKGKWEFLKEDSDRGILDTDIQFVVVDYTSLVMMGDRMRTCGSLLDEHVMKKNPTTPTIAYDLVDAPTPAITSFFTVKTRIACYFCVEPLPDGGKPEVTRSTIGSVKPWNFWLTKVHFNINVLYWLGSLGLT